MRTITEQELATALQRNPKTLGEGVMISVNGVVQFELKKVKQPTRRRKSWGILSHVPFRGDPSVPLGKEGWDKAG
jgi:hypothetical protein